MHPESDPLQEIWTASANRPEAETAGRLATTFATRLRTRRRRQAVWLVWTLFVMTAITAFSAVQVSRGRVAGVAEGVLLASLLALPWLATALLVRRFLRDASGRAIAGLSIRDLLVVARRANRSARLRLRTVAVLIAVMMPLLVAVIVHLHSAGKAATGEAWSMAAFFFIALTGSLVAMAWHHRRHLMPECRHLDALARDLDLG